MNFSASRLAPFLALFLVHCGSDQNSNLKSSASEEPTPMLVVMGGNSSCIDDETPIGMQLFQPFQELHAHMETMAGKSVPYLVSCYNSGGTKIFYQTSVRDGAVLEGTMTQVFDDLNTAIAVVSNPKIFVLGHSYGGWLSLKTAQDLEARQVRTHALFSIDPISRINCTFANPANCTSAPKDISLQQYAAIGANVDNWINFYQTQTFYLHSSAIQSAKENIKIATSHTSIDTHAKVWERIYQIAGQEVQNLMAQQ